MARPVYQSFDHRRRLPRRVGRADRLLDLDLEPVHPREQRLQGRPDARAVAQGQERPVRGDLDRACLFRHDYRDRVCLLGHAHRGVSSSPSPGSYNLHLEAGEPTPTELISDIKQGFYVTDLIGSGVNGVTGDYSRGASGFWIENGEITFAVSEVTIAGHLLEIFKTLTPANDLEFRYGVNAPTVRIEGLTVGGR